MARGSVESGPASFELQLSAAEVCARLAADTLVLNVISVSSLLKQHNFVQQHIIMLGLGDLLLVPNVQPRDHIYAGS